MVTELVVAGITTYVYHKISYSIKYKDEIKIKEKWDKIMSAAGLKNKNEYNNTFNIKEITKTDYGYKTVVNIPDGLDSDKLKSLKTTLQDNLKCLVELDKQRFSNYITVKIITNPLNDLIFKHVKTKPYELFLGYDYTGKPVILNLNKFPHLLIGGVTGTGKSRLVYTILTNLIHNNSAKEIEVYLTQIRKKDLKHFKVCEQIKWYAERLDETKDMFTRIDKIIEKRTVTIDNSDCDNIEEYNQKSKIKMKYIYIFAEEFSFYMPDNSDDEEIAKLKASTLKYLKNIIMSGRSVGANVICSVQRSTVDNIPSSIKSQMTRVTFRQMSKINSDNIIECGDAVGLEEKETILFTNQYVYIKTPYIDKKIILDNIKSRLLDVPVQPKVQNQFKIHYERHKPTPEEFSKMKDITIRNISVDKNTSTINTEFKESKISIKTKKRKNGIINISEVRKNAN